MARLHAAAVRNGLGLLDLGISTETDTPGMLPVGDDAVRSDEEV